MFSETLKMSQGSSHIFDAPSEFKENYFVDPLAGSLVVSKSVLFLYFADPF